MSPGHHNAIIAALAMFCTVAQGILFGGGNSPEGPGGCGPLTYDASMGEPLLPVFRQLSDDIPVGYETRELLDSLPQPAAAELAFVTYGDPNSRCVAIALMRAQPTRLFVDLDRNGHFGAGEEMPRNAGDSGDRWQLDLDAEFVVGPNQFDHARRRVELRINQVTGKLELATLGCMRGRVSLDNRSVDVLRTDCNGNGLWFDPDDRFWIDVDGDSRFDPLREKFACRTTCFIDGTQFAVAADSRGLEFRLQRIDGMGTLVPTRICADTSARVIDCEATLVSDTGVQVFLRDAASAVAVPVGTYRLYSLRLSMRDTRGHWYFLFASNVTTSGPRWEVRKDERTEIPLVGQLALHATTSLQLLDGQTAIVVTPYVTTSTGLYLTNCLVGESAARDPNCARSRSTVGDRIVDMGSSGFT